MRFKKASAGTPLGTKSKYRSKKHPAVISLCMKNMCEIGKGENMKYLLGIDNGGTFSKAAIFDENGKQISVASVPTITLTPKPGYTEKDLDELWQVNADAIRGAIEKSGINPKDIAGVSFSGAGKGLYMIGHDGKPSHNGIMSTDTRAWAQVERWYKDGTNKKVYEKTFQEILAVQPVSLLAWFRENQPEVLRSQGLHPLHAHRRSLQRVHRLLRRQPGKHGDRRARS